MSRLRQSIPMFNWKYLRDEYQNNGVSWLHHSEYVKITSHQLSRNGISYRRRVLYKSHTADRKPQCHYLREISITHDSSVMSNHWSFMQWCINKRIFTMKYIHISSGDIFYNHDYMHYWTQRQYISMELIILKYHFDTNIKSTTWDLMFHPHTSQLALQ